MSRTPLRLVLIAAVAALLLAGCGTSGGDDASDSPTTTKADTATTAPEDTTTEAEVDDTTDTTEAEPTDTTAPAGEDICVPLKVLSDFDKESGALINGGDWPATQQFFIDHTDDVLAAYDDAIAIDSEVTADLEALKAVTETTADTAAGSSDLMDFSTKLLDQPGIMEAGASGLALNTFAEENCGFSTGGN